MTTITLNLPDALNARAMCPACGDTYTITKDKRIHAHGIDRSSQFSCPGSGLIVTRVVVDAAILDALMQMVRAS